ncbi:NACHT domain-containing protein [Egbenema bharatensis]|uniref:NACHT domain-containing protein n=1 Tax=Egbenema bharatensis TaxID=3463334 RepID=UPI003A866CD5
MAKPSLIPSQLGIQIANQALTRTGWTKEELRKQVGCSKQPITHFFQGKPITQSLFIQICDRLGLNWQEISELPTYDAPIYSVHDLVKTKQLQPQETHPLSQGKLDERVQALRQTIYTNVRERCGTIRVLDMSHPVEVDDLYITVNVLQQITGRRHKRLDELLQKCDLEEFDRFGLGQVEEERVPGMAAVRQYRKLIILGKPGAGKTTFLKHLAIQCNEGYFEPDRLPIFVTLKDFAEAEHQPGLLEYISEKALHYSTLPIAENVSTELLADFYTIFQAGRALILLDGLDEVRAEDHHRVIKEIRDFSEQFWNNPFVMTCRIAAWEYTFEKFTEVEVADFDENQIAAFLAKWFKGKSTSLQQFLKYLHQNPRIKQLSMSPLLLTLVCLAFEESGDCPSSRSELYKEGIDALLKKWDAKRGIQRDGIYRNLSAQRKEDLLSYIAAITFRQKDYFFKQTSIERYITDYIRNLPRYSLNAEELQLDSEAILRSIEAQHGLLVERAKGIYSFSHLSFHEYFVAREIAYNTPSLDVAIQELSHNVTHKRWREVFLLLTEMLRDASSLLVAIKQEIDRILATSEPLQNFLAEICDRAEAPEFAFCKPAAVRAFLFDIDFEIDENRTVALHLDRSANLLVCASFLTRMLDGITLNDAIAIAQNYDAKQPDVTKRISAASSANSVMMIAIKIALESRCLEADARKTLKSLLLRLKHDANDETLKQVADTARTVAKTRYHIGQGWQFSPQERGWMKQYYNATQLLVECLHTDGCMMPPEARQRLEATLFKPLQSPT